MTEPIETEVLLDCRAELAGIMAPAPDDLLAEMSPLTRLFFVEQLAYEMLGSFVAMAVESEGDEDVESSDLSTVLECMAQAAGMLDTACILLGILPTEAQP